MTPSLAIALILSAAYLALAARGILRLPVSRGAKTILGCLRLVLLALLWVAFWEPSLTIDRLRLSRPAIPVFVDLSRSMQLFAPESSAVPFLRALREYADTARHPRVKLQFYGFGDSLRPIRNLQDLRFDDRSSDFPALPAELQEAEGGLIVSDGNWTNDLLPHGVLETRENRYAVLPRFAGRPYLRARVLACAASVPLDSANAAAIEISGLLKRTSRLTVECRDRRGVSARRVTDRDSGYFRDTVMVPLTASPAGRHFLTFTVGDGDSLTAGCRAVQDVLPGKFTARLYSAAPSLDRRFLSLALKEGGQWTVPGDRDTSASPDALFVFSWDDQARSLIGKTSLSTVLVFLGTLPCETRRITGFATFAALPGRPPVPTSAAPPQDLPPPAALLDCKKLPFTRPEVLHEAVIPTRMGTGDTIPLLMSGRFERRWSLALAARGLWRWDFWPRERGAQQEQVRYSSRLLDLVKQRILLHAVNAFYLYPADEPSQQYAPVHFLATLPAQAELAQKAEIHLRITRSDGRVVADTSYTPLLSGNAGVIIPALDTGTYVYSAQLKADGQSFGFGDTLTVEEDCSEFMIQGMNTVILSQFASQLDLGDAQAAIRDLVKPATQGETRRIVRQDIDFKQTIWLLLIIILILSIEWFYRKKLELD